MEGVFDQLFVASLSAGNSYVLSAVRVALL